MSAVRFLADSTLGKLAKWLRILGYDTEYCRAPGDDALIQQAAAEDRQIVTRNTRLGKRAGLEKRICTIKANDPLLQVREVIAHYHLTIAQRSHLTRCLICNRKLVKTSPQLLVTRVPEYVLNTRNFFLTCPACCKVYWRGSHYQSMQERIKRKLIER